MMGVFLVILFTVTITTWAKPRLVRPRNRARYTDQVLDLSTPRLSVNAELSPRGIAFKRRERRRLASHRGPLEQRVDVSSRPSGSGHHSESTERRPSDQKTADRLADKELGSWTYNDIGASPEFRRRPKFKMADLPPPPADRQLDFSLYMVKRRLALDELPSTSSGVGEGPPSKRSRQDEDTNKEKSSAIRRIQFHDTRLR